MSVTPKLERLHGKSGDFVKLNKLNDKWIFASRKDKTIVEGNDKPDAVVIIANDKHGRLLVIKEKRPIVGDYIWGFPAGLVDKDETIFQAAEREIREETGMKLILPSVSFYYNTFASPGITDEKVSIVKGWVDGELSNEGQELDEDITPYLLSADELSRFGFDNPNIKMSIWLGIHLLG